MKSIYENNLFVSPIEGRIWYKKKKDRRGKRVERREERSSAHCSAQQRSRWQTWQRSLGGVWRRRLLRGESHSAEHVGSGAISWECEEINTIKWVACNHGRFIFKYVLRYLPWSQRAARPDWRQRPQTTPRREMDIFPWRATRSVSADLLLRCLPGIQDLDSLKSMCMCLRISGCQWVCGRWDSISCTVKYCASLYVKK